MRRGVARDAVVEVAPSEQRLGAVFVAKRKLRRRSRGGFRSSAVGALDGAFRRAASSQKRVELALKSKQTEYLTAEKGKKTFGPRRRRTFRASALPRHFDIPRDE